MGINEWYTNWPHLIKLWPKILVIPSSMAICERRFFKTKISYEEPLASFIEVGQFGCLMQDRAKEYGLKTIFNYGATTKGGHSIVKLNTTCETSL